MKKTEILSSPVPRLIDRYRRHLNYLRVSITDRCDLRCLYCKPDGLIPKLSHEDVLTYEEILRLIRIAVSLGITKVRITGGEPLVRQGVCDFLSQLCRIDGITDVSLTTNGFQLAKYLPRLKDAGVHRLNISLDTLDPEKYRKITGVDGFRQVWSAIELARELGFSPIKINAVALKGYNDDELVDMARLSISQPFHIRFIEYMPIGTANMRKGDYLHTADIKRRLAELGPLLPVKRGTLDGPAERFRFAGAEGEVGFISAMSNHFCDACNRLRLSASGKLRSCLMSDKQKDLRPVLRQGGSDEDLVRVFLASVHAKPARHHLTDPKGTRVNSQMSSIGG
ncbi:MAG: GTP 3',8-cyclase MoaA [Deltaproteobacteria bacterium]|nr:MAG: GTP 3',8-cyclase MoaA [Deltaproteobacteria bacterium]